LASRALSTTIWGIYSAQACRFGAHETTAFAFVATVPMLEDKRLGIPVVYPSQQRNRLK